MFTSYCDSKQSGSSDRSVLLGGRCPLLCIYLLIYTLISESVCVHTMQDIYMFLRKRKNQRLIDWFAVANGAYQEFLSQIVEGWQCRSFMSVVRVSNRSKWNSILRAALQHRRSDRQRAAHRERSDSAVETLWGRQNSLFHFHAAPRLYLHRC